MHVLQLWFVLRSSFSEVECSQLNERAKRKVQDEPRWCSAAEEWKPFWWFSCALVAKPHTGVCMFFPLAFIFSRMLGMQNKYEMFRTAVCTVASLSSAKSIILPDTYTTEITDLYFSLHGTSRIRNSVNGC